MRKLLVAAIALACAPDSAAAVDGEDPIHDLIQQFLSDVWEGVDFGEPQFTELVAADDVGKLSALRECELGEVRRAAGDAMALVRFACPPEVGQSVAVMLRFDEQMIAEIDVISFVQVGVQ